jgi:hypothetical protein
MVKLIALKEFDGLEGKKQAGDAVEVDRKDRAEALVRYGLAEYPQKKAAKVAKEDKEAADK